MRLQQYLLDIFRISELAPVFKNAYLLPAPTDSSGVPAEQPPVQDVSSGGTLTHAPEAGAYPFVQPMKAALYFDSAKGFGQWRILISNGASQYLRQARKKDPPTFRIIINKIKCVLTITSCCVG